MRVVIIVRSARRHLEDVLIIRNALQFRVIDLLDDRSLQQRGDHFRLASERTTRRGCMNDCRGGCVQEALGDRCRADCGLDSSVTSPES